MLYKRKGLVERISPQGTQHCGGNFTGLRHLERARQLTEMNLVIAGSSNRLLTGSRYNRITSIDKRCVSHRLLDVPTLML